MSCHLTNIGSTLIPPTGLLVSQCPKLWKRRPPGQSSIILYHVRHGLSAENIHIQVSIRGRIEEVLLFLLAEIDVASEGIVKEEAVHPLLFLADQERNRLIQRMEILRMGLWNIGIPILILIIFLV